MAAHQAESTPEARLMAAIVGEESLGDADRRALAFAGSRLADGP